MQTNYSPLLPPYLENLRAVAGNKPVLDLACGGGRNGLYLIEQGISVVFADKNKQALDEIKAFVDNPANELNASLARYWQIDFETGQSDILPINQFAAVLIFRYLHRPIMSQIQHTICNGGMLIYETFLQAQAYIGRPKNPAFLLVPGELKNTFSKWQSLHEFEGKCVSESGQVQAIAQLVAIKP